MSGDGSQFTLFTEGDELFAQMLRDIDIAQHTVSFEVYIFKDDRIGGQFIDALAAAAKRGLDVRLRLDAFGSLGKISNKSLALFRQAGVKLQWHGRWDWLHPFTYGRRNHRKLLVIDEDVAYLGGFNIGDESSGTSVGPSRWRDTHLRVTGLPARRAAELYRDFIGNRDCGQEVWSGDSLLLPNYDVGCRYRWRCILQHQLRRASQRIWVTTPYFVPDTATQRELRTAAERGVDVKLLVPGKSDVPIAQWAARLSYDSLLRVGVKIYEYEERVLHAKTILIDTDWSSVGTSNLDYRSLFINDELNLITHSSRLNSNLAYIFSDDLVHARLVPRVLSPDVSPLRLLQGVVGWVCRKWL